MEIWFWFCLLLKRKSASISSAFIYINRVCFLGSQSMNESFYGRAKNSTPFFHARQHLIYDWRWQAVFAFSKNTRKNLQSKWLWMSTNSRRKTAAKRIEPKMCIFADLHADPNINIWFGFAVKIFIHISYSLWFSQLPLCNGI